VEAVDAANGDAVLAMADRLRADFGVPDVIINNAGAGVWKYIEDTKPAEAITMMNAPYFAAFNAPEEWPHAAVRAARLANAKPPTTIRGRNFTRALVRSKGIFFSCSVLDRQSLAQAASTREKPDSPELKLKSPFSGHSCSYGV
jgi:NAD(P)-dependent dehydrogenase (short-subunit alcohol dehydrogenase family)